MFLGRDGEPGLTGLDGLAGVKGTRGDRGFTIDGERGKQITLYYRKVPI